jgi:hypothetical protein
MQESQTIKATWMFNSSIYLTLDRCYTTFYRYNLLMFILSLRVCPWQAIPEWYNGAYQSEAPLRCSTLGRLLTLIANIRLGWNGVPGKNTLAYYKHLKITAVKSCITLGTRQMFLLDKYQDIYLTVFVYNNKWNFRHLLHLSSDPKRCIGY